MATPPTLAGARSTHTMRGFGLALRYPGPMHLSHVAGLCASLERPQPEASHALAGYLVAVSEDSLATLQERYTRTFDVTPVCAPYLSVHLFGVESNERTALMTGLAATYASTGFPPSGELPDHLALVLRAAPRFCPAEWHDIATILLPLALPKMLALLDVATNAYGHLLRAVQCALPQASDEQVELLASWQPPLDPQTQSADARSGRAQGCGYDGAIAPCVEVPRG